MKNMRKGLALLLSVIILVGMMPIHTIAAETAPETTYGTTPETTSQATVETNGETVPTTTGETTAPETTVETTVPETAVPETSVPETSVPETSVPETSVPEKVKVSCSGQFMEGGELIPGNDTISAEGYNLVGISAIWVEGYDELLTELYGDSYYASPYEVNVEGYVPGEPITLTVTMPADILMPENVAVYYIDADGNYRRIDNITVRKVEQEEPPADEEAEQEELPTDEEVEQEKLLLTEVEFTVTELGVFAIGNEPAAHYWSDDTISFGAFAMGLTGVSAVDQKGVVDTGNTFTDYICYTIVPEGAAAEGYVSYAIAMPEEFDMDNLALYAVLDEGLFSLDFTVENGVVSFEYFGEFTIACGVAAVPGGYPLIGLELTGNLPTDCFVGESVSLTDAKVTAVYAKDGDEFRKVLHPVASYEEDGYMVTADTSVVGQTTVYVTYGTATATFTINVHQEQFEDNETGVRVEVGTFGTTGVSVEVLDNALFEQSPLLNHVENFVAYDIDLTGYRQGDMATVTLPIPEGVERPAVYYVPDDGTEVVRMPATINGDGTISFETNHFSTYALGEERYETDNAQPENYQTPDGSTIILNGQTMTRPGSNTQETIWQLVDSLTAGKNYLIVSKDTAGSANLLGHNNDSITDPSVMVLKGNETFGTYIKNEEIPSNAVWTVEGSYKFKNGNYYIRRNNNSLQLGTSDSNNTFTTFNNNQLYYTTTSWIDWFGTDHHLTYDSGWKLKDDSGNVYFYALTTVGTMTPEILYYVTGTNVTNAPAIQDYKLNLSSVLNETMEGTTTDITASAGITPIYEVVRDKGDPSVITSIDANGVATMSGETGTAVVKVTYENGNLNVWDEFVITAKEPEYKLELSQPKQDENGNTVYEPITTPIVKKNVKKGDTDNIWAVITANGEDLGKLTDAQLSKLTFVSSNEDIAKVDSKTGKVTFQGGEGTVVITAVYEYADGKSITDTVVFSVSKDQYVVPEDGTSDFPEYPNEGSIRFDKHATAVGNFSNTGMVQVELSMTGVPFTTGSEIDVVIMLDISTSMDDISGREDQAALAAQEALKLLVTNEDGTFNGNRVAIYGFCGWDSNVGGTNETGYTNYVENIAGEETSDGVANVYEMAGLQSYDQSKLTAAETAIETRYNNLGAGTNYAAALKQCQVTLDAAKKDGIGNNRKQYVIFMTDGAPSTGFAYVGSNGEKQVYAAQHLAYDGFDTSSSAGNITVTTLVNLTEYYSLQMKNDGVEIYSVAMQIDPGASASNRQQKINAAHTLLENIATDSEHALVVESGSNPSEVVDVFQNIAQEIRQAATDVKVTDKISEDYTMVFDVPNDHVGVGIGDQDYYIEVREYQLNAETDANGNITDYTRGSYDSKVKLYMGVNGNTYYAATAANSIGGNNKFAAPSFNTTALGTLYYWSTDQAKGDSGISVKGADGNTYYFVSTGKGTHNMISGAYAYGTVEQTYVTDAQGNATDKVNKTSQDLIIATPYFVYNAATRMLVWTADKLSSTELALSYFLYLDRSGGHSGSIHETPAGTYATNDYAHLQYTNFQNNPCEQVFPVPQMTWNGAQVSYVFYLVNKNGQPVNRAGRVVPFSEAVYVTDVFTHSITWTELETSDALEAEQLAVDLVPDVYKLYDEGAAYKIHVYEDENQANLNNHFVITNGDGVTVNTTYVFNTKSDAVKYTAPGIYAERGTFLCRGEGTVTATFNENGTITSASYSKLNDEVCQKQFDSKPHGAVFYDANTKFAYFKGAKDADGNDTYYTIVEKSGASNVANGFDFSNTTVAFAVMWLPQLETDTVVIDFGLDVMVEVAINDALATEVLGVLKEKPDVEINTGTYAERKSTNAPIDLDITVGGEKIKVGTAYADTQNSVRVSLDKKKGMLVKDPLLFYYESKVTYYSGTNSETLNTEIMYSSVTVIPATTIYYEDEYVTLSSESKDTGSWQAITTGSGWDAESKAATNLQSNDRPGESKVSELYDADNLYGYDPAYSECSTYSLSSAAKFTANATKRGVASFEFYGTGFDVIAMTSKTTGTIIVKLYPWENGAYSSTAKASYIVDTYYGYTYKGINQETGEKIWEVTTDDSNALYQVPVMKLANQPYGRYKAEIQIRYSPAFDHTGKGSYEFYLDAIRIYDPAGDDPTNETVKDAYEKDGESWPVYAELRDWVIGADTYDTVANDGVNGAVFIDGMGELAAVADYKNFGPNNELYLAKGQAVSFHLDGLSAKTIQLAMKSVGGTAKPKIWYIDGEAKEYKSYDLSTATDMYYDITALKGKDVVIRNDGDAILSITNVKMTFTNQTDKPATAEEIAQVMSVNRVGTEAVLRFMRRPPQDLPPIPEVPETTAPETTVPETTVPETTVPETTVPETTVPETTVPETTVPETTVPETTVPETTVPETTVPETTVPETTVPETTVPETTVPETTVPETTVPETTVPETTVPKNPASKPTTGSKPTEPKPTETTPAEPESTVAEATEPVEQPSDDPEIAVTEEPEQQEQNRPLVEEQISPAEEETPETEKSLWEMFVDWITNLFNFIIGLFGGWY